MTPVRARVATYCLCGAPVRDGSRGPLPRTCWWCRRGRRRLEDLGPADWAALDPACVATANDRLGKAEQAWRDAQGAALNVEGPKDTSPWGLISWALSTGLLVVLNEKRKRDAKTALEEAKRDSREVVARQDDAPFVGTAGRLEPETRLADAPTRLDALESALRSAGLLKGA